MKFLVLTFALLSFACQKDLQIKGGIGDKFRSLIGHQAVTISEKKTIYFGDDPPSVQLICHEDYHKDQAKFVGDVWVKFDIIDDDELERMGAWVSAYGISYAGYGYANRWELAAQEACKCHHPATPVCEVPDEVETP